MSDASSLEPFLALVDWVLAHPLEVAGCLVGLIVAVLLVTLIMGGGGAEPAPPPPEAPSRPG